jgi:hypothetical protein
MLIARFVMGMQGERVAKLNSTWDAMNFAALGDG